MTTITTDFAPGDSTAVVNTKLSTIAQYWGGASALTGVTTYGGVRTVLNGFANAANQIADQELGASFITKLNWLNNIEDVVDGGLFASSEPGVWFDPSDLTTLFQDNLGTTPVTTPGQTVGLMLDKSQGLVLGSELVTNGDFSGGSTGWSDISGAWAVTGGVLQGTSVGASAYGPYSNGTGVVAGLFYSVTFTLTVASGGLFARVGNEQSAAYTSSGTYTRIFQAVTTGVTVFQVRATGAGFTGTIDDISVKLLAGNHATQATAASRPTYGIVPLGGRRNVLTWSEDFTNGVWAKNNSTISANSATAPDGTMTADKLQETAVTAAFAVLQTPAVALSTTYVLTVYMKAAERSFGILNIFTGAASCWTWFNLAAGTVGTVGSGATASISNAGSGWYRCSISIATAASGTPNIGIWPANANGSISYAGTAGSGILIWGAQLEVGSTATAYQRVTTQFDVTQAGVASLSYLSFDGVDDSMVTSTITPGTDKVQVFAGVRKLSDAALGILCELSATTTTNDGVFRMTCPVSTTPSYGWFSKGTVSAAPVAATGFAAPITNVVTGIGDISGDVATIRVNGVVLQTITTDQGTGNYLAYPLYLGRRSGASNPFNGQMYSLIARFGANLTTPQISQWENFTNAKTGAY